MSYPDKKLMGIFAVVLSILVTLVLSYIYFFPQDYEPHQVTTNVSEPYFQYEYVRHLVPNRCVVSIEPKENLTIRSVSFLVTTHDGILVSYGQGTQNNNNSMEWLSEEFTANLTSLQSATNPGNGENGWITCNATVQDSDFDIFKTSTLDNVGYSISDDCNTSNDCLIDSAITEARGYYYYDNITMDSSGSISIEVAPAVPNYPVVYFTAKEIDFAGEIKMDSATGGGAKVTFDSINTSLDDVTLSGIASTTCAVTGGPGGELLFKNFRYVELLGNVIMNGGDGHDCTSGGANGGDGGTAGMVSFSDSYSGIVNITGNMTLLGGDGGDGDTSAPDGGFGGDGGGGIEALSFSGVNVFISSNFTLIRGGNAGAGGDGNASGFGGDGGDGGAAGWTLSRSAFRNSANISAYAGNGNDGGTGGAGDGVGGDGGTIDWSGISGNSTGPSIFNHSGYIYFECGDGGDGSTGGDASCFQLTNCSEQLYFHGTINTTGGVEFANCTGGSPGGNTPAVGTGWEYYYNQSVEASENNFTKFAPNRTNKSANLNIWGIPYLLKLQASAGMIRYDKFYANATEDSNSTGFYIFVVGPDGEYKYVYTSNQSGLDMHRYQNGTYTVEGYGYNGYGLRSPLNSTTATVNYIPVSVSCNNTPVNLTNLTQKNFTVNCYVNNTVDNSPLYWGTFIVNSSGLKWYLSQENITEPYTGINELYYSGKTVKPIETNFVKTDYNNATFSLGDISFKPIIIEIPSTVTDVTTICLFPYHLEVIPIGQTFSTGIFRIINLDADNNRTVFVKLNETLPENITQGMNNLSNTNWTNMILLNTSFQRTVTNMTAFDGTQNVTNYSAYRWLYTNCTNASYNDTLNPLTHYLTYDWYSFAIATSDDFNYTDSFYLCDGECENSFFGWNGTIISSFNATFLNSSGFTIASNTNSTYYREENNTVSTNANWSSSGLGYVELNFSVIGSGYNMTNVTHNTSGNASFGTVGLHIYLENQSNISNNIILSLGTNSSAYSNFTAFYLADYPLISDHWDCLQCGVMPDNCSIASGRCWTEINYWNWVRFNLTNASSQTGTINWNNISYVRVNFNKTSTTGVMYLDYMSAADNSIGWNIFGERNLSRSTLYTED